MNSKLFIDVLQLEEDCMYYIYMYSTCVVYDRTYENFTIEKCDNIAKSHLRAKRKKKEIEKSFLFHPMWCINV